MKRTALLFFVLAMLMIPILAYPQSYEHLARAITLYEEGRLDEAFDETTQQIDITEKCPAAYYYRALIRAKSGDYRRAGLSLAAALRDSSGYTDAMGLNAYILKNRGKQAEALTAWKQFVTAAGDIVADGATPASIVLPEDYYTLRLSYDGNEAVKRAPTEEAALTADEALEKVAVAIAEPEPQKSPLETTRVEDEESPELPAVAEAASTPEGVPDNAELAVEDAAAKPEEELKPLEFPMPIIDYIAAARGVKPFTVEEIERGWELSIEPRDLVVYALSAVLLFLLLLKLAKMYLMKANAADDLDFDLEIGGELEAVQEVETVKADKAVSVFDQAHQLKSERTRHAREVERLLRKV